MMKQLWLLLALLLAFSGAAYGGAAWYEPPGGPATTVSDYNRLIVEQNGVTRSITRGMLLHGVGWEPGFTNFSGANIKTGNLVTKGPWVDVRWFGAKCDWTGSGGSDNTAAINAAISYAAALNRPLWFPQDGLGYKTTAGVTVPSGVSVIMDAPIIAAATNVAALTIGDGTPNFATQLKLNVERATLSDWTNTADIGIKLINTNACSDIHIVAAQKFTIGVKATGEGSGFSYNTVRMGLIAENKYGIVLSNKTVSSASGWCNENVFTGGRFTVGNSTNVTSNRYGVWFTSDDTTYINNNNNYFIKPSFELNASHTSGLAVAIQLDDGKYNEFRSIRSEGNDWVAQVTGSSSANKIEVGYLDFGANTVNDTSNYPNTQFTVREFDTPNSAYNFLFSSGPMHTRASYYDGSSITHVPGLFGVRDTFAPTYGATGVTYNANYLSFDANRGFGVVVSTSKVKKFVVRRDTDAGYPGRVKVICYDASGTQLDASAPTPADVTGLSTSAAMIYWSSSFGGSYALGNDYAGDVYFQVSANVASIRVLVTGGSTPIRIRSFTIFAAESGTAAVTPGYYDPAPGYNLGTAAPTAGTWELGRFVANVNHTAGTPLGWKCVAAGTPGTWEPVSNGADSTTALTAKTVTTTNGGSDGVLMNVTTATNFSAGDAINKRGATGDATAAVLSGAEIGIRSDYGWDGSAYGRGAFIRTKATENYSSGHHGTLWELNTTRTGANTPVPSITVDGAGAVTLAGPLTVTGTINASNGGSGNHAVCWKSDSRTLGYCSTAPDASGVCTCN